MTVDSIAENIAQSMDDIADIIDHWFNEHFFNIVLLLISAIVIQYISAHLFNQLIKHAVRSDVYPTKTDREKRIKTMHSLANGVIRLMVYVVAAILIVGEINPKLTTALFASAGLIGVAFGFGAQSLIRDLTTGIFIILENQYRIGDEVTITAGMGMGDVEGIVEDLTIRTTVLRDLSGNVHHVPNGNIGITSNKTLGYSRMNENIEVALTTDLDELERIIKDIGKQLASDPELEPKILEPPYLASVKGFTEDGVIVRVSAKTTPAAQWKVRSEFYKHLKLALKRHRIRLAGESEPSDTED
jgi:small conductance mechanosensitive channel